MAAWPILCNRSRTNCRHWLLCACPGHPGHRATRPPRPPGHLATAHRPLQLRCSVIPSNSTEPADATGGSVESGDPKQTTGSAAPAAPAHAALSGARMAGGGGTRLAGALCPPSHTFRKLACLPLPHLQQGLQRDGRMAAPGEDVYWAFLRDYCTALKHGELSSTHGARCGTRSGLGRTRRGWISIDSAPRRSRAAGHPSAACWHTVRSAGGARGRQPSFPLGRRRAAAACRRTARPPHLWSSLAKMAKMPSLYALHAACLTPLPALTAAAQASSSRFR